MLKVFFRICSNFWLNHNFSAKETIGHNHIGDRDVMSMNENIIKCHSFVAKILCPYISDFQTFVKLQVILKLPVSENFNNNISVIKHNLSFK